MEETADFPTQEDIEMEIIERDYYPPGRYRVEKKVSGITKESFYFEKPEASFFSTRSQDAESEGIGVDADEYDDTDPQHDEAFASESNSGSLTEAEVKLMFAEEKLRRMEEELQRRTEERERNSAQTDMQLMMAQMRADKEHEREMWKLMLANSQRPQQDPTTMALDLMEKSFGMVTKARAFADEIAPGERSGGGESEGGFLADGAKLLDSVGRNAGTFMPLIAPIVSSLLTPQQPQPVPLGHVAAPTPTVNNGGGELADLAARARNNGTPKEEQNA